jgi:hypothetical protein
LAGEHEFCPKCDEEIGYKEAAGEEVVVVRTEYKNDPEEIKKDDNDSERNIISALA